MDNEGAAGRARIALASYDRKELRVQKNYLQEGEPALDCVCHPSGQALLEQLQQGTRYDLIVLCSQMVDMSGEEFARRLRRLSNRPPLILIRESGGNSLALQLGADDKCRCMERLELKSLLGEICRMPGQKGQQLEQRCRQLYDSWGAEPEDINCAYLTDAVAVVLGTSQKLAIRKEILQAVGEKHNASVSAVYSGIRRMIDQLEAAPTGAWNAFRAENGFAGQKPTIGKLIYAVKNTLLRPQKDR